MSVNWWMDKYNAIYAFNNYYLERKRYEVLTYATTWMRPQKIILSRRSQSQRTTCHTISLTWNVLEQIGRPIETEIRLVVAYGWEWVGLWMIAKGYRISFWSDKKVLKLIVVMVVPLSDYFKNDWEFSNEWIV